MSRDIKQQIPETLYCLAVLESGVLRKLLRREEGGNGCCATRSEGGTSAVPFRLLGLRAKLKK